MPIVTDIKTQVKNQEKVSVFIDGKYSFSLLISQLAEQKSVRVGKEIAPEKIEELKKLSQYTKQYLRMISLVYARPRSEYEIRTKLRLKKVEPEEAEQIITQLTSKGYLNDQKFAEWWVNSRKSTRSISILKLKSELAQKGIKSSTIEEVISENFTKEDELQALKELVAKKKDKYETDQKLMTHLASKGFTYSQIKEVLGGGGNGF